MKDELILISLGSNLPYEGRDSLSVCLSAVALLRQMTQLRILKCSSWYHSAPYSEWRDVSEQNFYVNGVILIRSCLSPLPLLTLLHKIEHSFGRVRTGTYHESRTLDLDLLSYGNRLIKVPRLTLPHPRMTTRSFVLAPLMEIMPSWRHPRTGIRVTWLARHMKHAPPCIKKK